ncbi:hypothetical protein AUC61_20775 [Pseudomonas sp. S25]|uniref:DUF4136 domain-containing protein n=1 Tax=Pseudomonas maioricensis TaxID=1766623 RepID=A0ABS9ZNW8_9PSED|nr:hypothetical protein [Pseudomonas sp. S25]MCI8211971.1 hypothetical protein [Pseudomonas sp. S25]
MPKKMLILAFLAANSLVMAACQSKLPQQHLEQVAKDWSMTVRAAQVMPIYPLEEYILPGDLYLSHQSVDAEIETWKEKGFLPLVNRDNYIPISTTYYDEYYSRAASENRPSFAHPPAAAFPSYSFTVDSRGSAGFALPLASVPIALSAAGAQSATGSVVLKGATSLGLPNQKMDEIVQAWASAPLNKAWLSRASKLTSSPPMLRVITRVFSITGATVSLTFSTVSGGSLNVGAPASTPDLVSTSSASYDALISNLNTQVALKTGSNVGDLPTAPNESDLISKDPELAALQADIELIKRLKTQQQLQALRQQISSAAMESKFGGYLLPGASIKIASRSERGVTMDETFKKPLVIGYWASQYLVRRDGGLIPVGEVQEVIDNPKLYKELEARAYEISHATPGSSPVDSGVPDADPFTKP